MIIQMPSRVDVGTVVDAVTVAGADDVMVISVPTIIMVVITEVL